MLIMCIATHNAENCSAHLPDRVKVINTWPNFAKEKGATIVSAHSCSPAHTAYYLFEADAMEQLAAAFDPVIEWATADFVPVVDSLASMMAAAAATPTPAPKQ